MGRIRLPRLLFLPLFLPLLLLLFLLLPVARRRPLLHPFLPLQRPLPHRHHPFRVVRPLPLLLVPAQAPLQLLPQYNVSTKKMSVSFAQENNTVKEYYNRTRGEKQANAKSKYLDSALASLRPRKGYKTRVRSPLHPLSEFEAQSAPNHVEANKGNMNNYLTPEERNLLKLVRGYGGRRTRRTRRRHRGSRRR